MFLSKIKSTIGISHHCGWGAVVSLCRERGRGCFSPHALGPRGYWAMLHLIRRSSKPTRLSQQCQHLQGEWMSYYCRLPQDRWPQNSSCYGVSQPTGYGSHTCLLQTTSQEPIKQYVHINSNCCSIVTCISLVYR